MILIYAGIYKYWVMRVLIIDPVNGAAGDMITSALIDLGADSRIVLAAMESIVSKPEIESVDRSGISAIYLKTNAPRVTRTFEEVVVRVKESAATDHAKELAIRIFSRIHKGETEVHGKVTHFHEVGADDAIADVIGACTALECLKPDAVYILPVPAGKGYLKSSHGVYPVPAPATLSILKNSDLLVRFAHPDATEGELCTPTGAAILAEFSSKAADHLPNGSITSIGYGAGSRNPDDVPNVLRAILMETAGAPHDTISILETNVDDVSGEAIAYTLSRLMEEGARDVSVNPLIMKKGRPGSLIRVICSQRDADRLTMVLSEELGTLGVREIPFVHRRIAERSIEEVAVTIKGTTYRCRIKLGRINGRTISLKAEFDDAAQCAKESGMSLPKVVSKIEATAWEQFISPGEMP